MARCAAVFEQFAALGDVAAATLRDLLCDADDCMRSAPLDLLKAFQRVDEEKLVASSRDLAQSIERDGLRLDVPSKIDARGRLFLLATAIRALDELLRDYSVSPYAFRSSARSRWQNSGRTHYVIPTRKPRAVSRAARSSYDKRGLRHHRIIPCTVLGLAVRLRPSRTLDIGSRETLVGGVALFPGMVATVEKAGEEFLVAAVECDDMNAMIERQSASLFDCDFAIWPELSVDDGSVDNIAREFSDLAMKRGSGNALVVAGSWHRRDEDGILRNRAIILDGKGRRIEHFDKISIYVETDAGFEAVVEGNEFLVMLWDGFCAAVCICKDFSDFQDGNPWTELPVDLVLVASMGEDKTMSSHLVNATQLRKGFSRLTAIAQQGLWNYHKEPTNYILPAPEDVTLSVAKTYFDGEAKTFECDP